MSNGIKSLARQLPNYGRYNDDMVAHISSDEAALLKSLGGAGTINPHTGLPEFGFNPFKAVEKAIIRPIGHVLKPIAQDLGIVGQLAATYFGGPIGAGLYAGIAGGGKGFDFKRALMAGALAYGAQNLTQGLEGAGGGASAGVDATASDVASNLGTTASTGAGSQSAMLADQAAGFGDAGLKSIQSGASYATPSGIDLVGPAAETTAGMADAANKSAFENFTDRVGQTASEYGSKLNQMSPYKDTDFGKVYEGAKGIMSGDKAALEGFKASGATLTNTALPMFMGYTGVKGIDETQRLKDEADLAAAKDEQERAAILNRIEESKKRGIEALRANPYMFAAGGTVFDDELGTDDMSGGGIASYSGEDGSYVSEDYLARRALEAVPESPERRTRYSFMPSGVVAEKDMKAVMGRLGADYPVGKTGAVSAGVSGIAGRLPEGMRARAGAADVGISGRVGPGIARAQMIRDLASRQNRYQLGYDIPFNKGGDTARFLSGDGDGMSDSIKATIEGKQPARLADGEFVIPADVVSHLGNGSSKAGAKKLYKMMDRVRVARTGTKQQGKEINPNKFLLA